MESNETENVVSEAEQQDGLQLIRDVNKYLRKALKKIETIQKNSYKLQQNPSIKDQIFMKEIRETVRRENSECCEDEPKIPSKRRKGSDNNKVHRSNTNSESEAQDNSNETIHNCLDEGQSAEVVPDEEVEPEPHEEVETDKESEPHEDTEPDDEDDDYEEIVNGSDEEVFHVVQMPLPTKPCIVTKFEMPTNFIPLPVFYKAFLANLPLTINVPKLKAWLETKGVSNYEDIIMYTKQTYKTSIVSYYDKDARDRLLLLDGELCESWPIKIRLHIDRFAPEVDKLAANSQKQK